MNEKRLVIQSANHVLKDLNVISHIFEMLRNECDLVLFSLKFKSSITNLLLFINPIYFLSQNHARVVLLFRSSIIPLLLLINPIYFLFQNHARVTLSVETGSAFTVAGFVTLLMTVEIIQMNRTAPIPLVMKVNSDVITKDVSVLYGSVMVPMTARIILMKGTVQHNLRHVIMMSSLVTVVYV